MINRTLQLPDQHSFFLFGARGTGKTHLLRQRFENRSAWTVDLLDADTHDALSLRPGALREQLAALPSTTEWVVTDEIQRIPSLLDVVHQHLESTPLKFALTGSSARKLKHGGANLLAGRAFVLNLFPLTFAELAAEFSLERALKWGTLPGLLALTQDSERQEYLRSYTHTYLREEILQEQLIRKLEPFRRFLAVAAQMSGQILNYSKIARDAGVSVVTIQSYFEILDETLVGFLLEPFHESIRKRQRGHPKFYFFDHGVLRALQNTLTVDLPPQTHAYGVAFEHFIVNEIRRLQSYRKKDFEMSYLRTKDGVEVDLILERPGRARALIEIKSTQNVVADDVASLNRIAADVPESEAYCFSRDSIHKKIGAVLCLPWREGIETVLS